MSDTGPIDLTEVFDIKPWSKNFGNGAATICCPDCVYGPVNTHTVLKVVKCPHGAFRGCKACERAFRPEPTRRRTR